MALLPDNQVVPVYYVLTYLLAHLLTYLLTCSLTYLLTCLLTYLLTQVVPVYYVTFTLASVSAGAICYFEFDCMTFAQVSK